MIKADYVIVGSGLTGATVARVIADAGRDVVVLERRPVLGGNVRDAVHGCGVRYNLHGPHYFRTNSAKLWEWVQRFGAFTPWAACVQTSIEGKLYRWPLPSSIERDSAYWRIAVNGYNQKMWGTEKVPRDVSKRVELRDDDRDLRLRTDKYQGVPTAGYSAWMDKMLLGVYCITGFDFLKRRDEVQYKTLVYTGPIDELYGFEYGKLQYRSMKRLTFFDEPEDLPVVQVNYPETRYEQIRRIGWNHMPWNKVVPEVSCLCTYEIPYTPTDPDAYEYPHFGVDQSALLDLYLSRARCDDIIPAGRLALHRYYDMDQAIAAGMTLGRKLLCG